MSTNTVYGDYPIYYKQPIRVSVFPRFYLLIEENFKLIRSLKWLRYHAHTRPHLYYSVVLGLAAPALALVLTPLRRKYLYPDHEPIPSGYPSMYIY